MGWRESLPFFLSKRSFRNGEKRKNIENESKNKEELRKGAERKKSYFSSNRLMIFFSIMIIVVHIMNPFPFEWKRWWEWGNLGTLTGGGLLYHYMLQTTANEWNTCDDLNISMLNFLIHICVLIHPDNGLIIIFIQTIYIIFSLTVYTIMSSYLKRENLMKRDLILSSSNSMERDKAMNIVERPKVPKNEAPTRQSWDKFCSESLYFPKSLRVRNFLRERGGEKILCRNFFMSELRRVGTTSCRKYVVSELWTPLMYFVMDIHNPSNPQSWAKCNLFSFYLPLKFFSILLTMIHFCYEYMLQNWFQHPNHKRNPFQVWILFLLEAPPNTQAFYNLNHVINWTATFRHDSDLVAPYEKYFKLPESSSIEKEGESNRFKSRLSVSFQSFLECMTKKYNRLRNTIFPLHMRFSSSFLPHFLHPFAVFLASESDGGKWWIVFHFWINNKQRNSWWPAEQSCLVRIELRGQKFTAWVCKRVG